MVPISTAIPSACWSSTEMREERDGPSPPDCRQRRRRLISLCVPNEHTHARLQTACNSAGRRRRRGGGQRCRRHAASSSAKQTSRDIIACKAKTSGSYGSSCPHKPAPRSFMPCPAVRASTAILSTPPQSCKISKKL
jgi:hypothetical protein